MNSKQKQTVLGLVNRDEIRSARIFINGKMYIVHYFPDKQEFSVFKGNGADRNEKAKYFSHNRDVIHFLNKEKGYDCDLIGQVIGDIQRDIDWKVQSNKENFEKYGSEPSWEKEIAEHKQRIKDIKRLWKTYGNNPVVQSMELVVKDEVMSYHEDFYYHDLSVLEKYDFPLIAWCVHDCGSHMIFLENDNDEETESQKSWFDAVNKTYGSKGTWFVCDFKAGVIKKMKHFSQIQFKIKKVVA